MLIGPKMKEKPNFLFLIYYNFFSISNLNLKFSVGLCFAIDKSYAKKLGKCIHETPIYANFSYKSAPKTVGRIDPSRFERVKHGHRQSKN